MGKNRRILINGQQIDVYDPAAIPISVDYEISDINNILIRKNGRSKSITAPASARNKQIFGFAEDINSASTLDQKQKPTGEIEVDGLTLIKGFAKVNIANTESGLSEYQFIILGDSGDWKERIREKKLSDLDYSSDDHYYTKAVIETSETVSASRNYVYDLIDRGKWSGYLGKSVNVGDRYPAISLSSFVTKIYKAIGYKVSSAFLTGSFFTKLYWIFVNDMLRHPDSWNDGQLAKAIKTGTQKVIKASQNSYVNNTITFENDSTGGGVDPGGNWGKYKINTHYFCPATGRYRLAFSINYDMYSNLGHGMDGGSTIYFSIRKSNKFDASVNGVLVYQASPISFVHWTLNQTVTVDAGLLDLIYGDELYVTVEIQTTNPAMNIWTTTVDVKANSYFEVKELNGVFPVQNGQLVQMNANLPNVGQLEFIQTLKEKYNLYFLSDPFTKTIYIESRDNFYYQTAEDWSSKVDKSRPIVISFIGDQYHKKTKYQYKKDSKDKFVDTWEKQNDTTLGAYTAELDNSFAKDGEGSFSTSIVAATIQDKSPDIGLTTTEIPKMWADDEQPVKSTSFAPRILYYAGVRNCLGFGENWRFNDTDDLAVQKATPSTPRTTYPAFFFHDNADYSDANLSFADNDVSHGLFNKYYLNTHRTIDDSRLYTAYLYLKDTDVSPYDLMRKTIYLEIEGNGTYFVINAIREYQSDNGSVKVELVKIVSKAPVVKLNRQVSSKVTVGKGQKVPKQLRVKTDPTTGNKSLEHGTTPLLTADEEGNVVNRGGPIYAEINNIMVPVYYTDSKNKLQNVIKET